MGLKILKLHCTAGLSVLAKLGSLSRVHDVCFNNNINQLHGIPQLMGFQLQLCLAFLLFELIGGGEHVHFENFRLHYTASLSVLAKSGSLFRVNDAGFNNNIDKNSLQTSIK